ncbi:MAG: hypothetical protein LIO42_01080 [Oscillospiraceae bacterium]|nr:hypothetical protein [Oscillospiraceae bacterium]
MAWSMERQGLRVAIRVWREDRGEGLYKAYLVGPLRRSLLGTLAPEGGRLTLNRTLSVDALQRQGLWPIRQVLEELVYPFQGDPVSWDDPVLRRCVRRLSRHTLLRQGEDFILSFPFDSGKPFPIPALFCFAQLQEGRLLFSFHAGGTPYISSKQGEAMEDDRGETD